MNKFPALDMAGALRLTRQGRLKEAVAALRGKGAGAPPPAEPSPSGPGLRAFLDDVFKKAFDRPAAPDVPFTKTPFKPAEHKAPPPDGARFEARSFTNAFGSRKYKLFIPAGYHGQALPLVVMLHGCTQSPDDFAAGTQMNKLAQAQGFLVAYPEQARGANVSKCWNWFKPADQMRDAGEPCLIAGITREIMREFAVQRVFIAGLSAGGAMAAIMGQAYPELYAAIGVHSGLARGAASDLPSALSAMKLGGAAPAGAARMIPTIVFHGDRDTTVNVANGAQVIAQSKGTAELRTAVTEGEAGGMRYTRTVLSTGHGQDALEAWVLHGAGHAWSGGSPDGSFADPHGPDASAEMMRFFMQV